LLLIVSSYSERDFSWLVYERYLLNYAHGSKSEWLRLIVNLRRFLAASKCPKRYEFSGL